MPADIDPTFHHFFMALAKVNVDHEDQLLSILIFCDLLRGDRLLC
jgi:hypothetical protein